MNQMGNAHTDAMDNDLLCNRLIEKKSLGSSEIIAAFRSVDRGDFVHERKR